MAKGDWKLDKAWSDAYNHTLVNVRTGASRSVETHQGKIKRYCEELRSGYGYTLGPDGKHCVRVKLSANQKAWRAGQTACEKSRNREFRVFHKDYVPKHGNSVSPNPVDGEKVKRKRASKKEGDQ